MKKNVIKNRIIKLDDFIWKIIKPSVQTKLIFIKLFKVFYPKFSENIDIKSLKWDKNEFFITLKENKSWEILSISIKDNFWNKKCSWIFCTDNICTWIHYELKNKYFLKFLVYFKVKGTYFNINTFLQILTKDLKIKKEYYQIFWKQNRPPFSVIQDWWHPLQKYRFVVHEWLIRNIDQSIKLNLPNASICHSERECKWISPNGWSKWYHFFNFPLGFYDHSFDKYYYLTEDEKKEYIYWKNEWNSIDIFTDLDENDIVMWNWTNKLSLALEYIVEKIEKNNIKMLSFNCCCVPRVIWDDIYSILKRTKEKINVPFIFRWQLEKTPYEQNIILLEEYIDKINILNIKKVKNSISLFWFHENIFLKELWNILWKNWIKTNTSFIPTIDIRLLELMYKSELFVFSPNNFQWEVFEYPFQKIWTEFISPKYPYWIINTENWLISILEKFELNLTINEEVNKIKDEYYDNIKIVKNKWYKIGIIFLWLQELKKFFNSDYMNNIDIIEFLEEMWFKLNFLIFDNFNWFIVRDENCYEQSDWNHEKIEEIIYNKIKYKENIKINYFSNDKEFKLLLYDNNLDLIYSDIYFDDRIINLWINQFNLNNFNIWYSWALKTIKWLINLCEMTFYKNYTKYFIN